MKSFSLMICFPSKFLKKNKFLKKSKFLKIRGGWLKPLIGGVCLVPCLMGSLAAAQDMPQTSSPVSDQSGQNSGIVVGQLAQVDPASVGLIDQLSGGFPSGMWARSNRPFIERLMPQLPSGIRSPALQNLVRRLLLTAAVVPTGDAGKPDLLEERLNQLENQGDLPQLLDLMDRLPPDRMDSDHVKRLINGLLLTGDVNAACDQTANISQDDIEPYWIEVMGFCQLHGGHQAGGNLAVEMLQDKGGADPVYIQLMARLSAGAVAVKTPVNLDQLQKLDPLLFAMLQIAGLEIPVRFVAKASPLMVQAMAMVASLPIDMKLEAAEKAAFNGSLKPEKLAEIYGAVAFSPVDGDAAALGQAPGARGNAFLYQAALGAADMMTRGPLIEAIWGRAKASGTRALQAHVNAAMLSAIEPSVEALPYAGEITRLLVLAGKYERALVWYDFIKAPYAVQNNAAPAVTAEDPDALHPALPEGQALQAGIPATTEAEKDPAVLEQAEKLQIALWPWAALADSRRVMHEPANGLEVWWQSQANFAPDVQRERATFLFSALDATGFKIPENDWGRLIEGNPYQQTALPALPYWRALTQAARDKRLGEAVLLSLIALGKAGPDKASPLLLSTVMSALEAAGLDAAARALGAEAMAARDF
jgi:hypothetical protein